jgi:type I restriction enzyme M protein
MPGSRKQKQLSGEEIERMAAAYRAFKASGHVDAVPGFCAVADLARIRASGHVLSPARFVGAAATEMDDEPFEDKIRRLLDLLRRQKAAAAEVDVAIAEDLKRIGYGK